MAVAYVKFSTLFCQALTCRVLPKSRSAILLCNRRSISVQSVPASHPRFESCFLHIKTNNGPAISGRISNKRGFCVRATQVSDSGAVDPPLMETMKNKIKEQLNAEAVVVKDAYGDGRHVSIEVVSLSFEGQSQVNRQRMVYKAIWEELQNTVHAVDQMVTRTPSEASQ
eukprot:TRINITY_DN1033_c0_g1_i1.p1 TRINITY_DN1033_c0_g1~~TRINITY_DN1033_c0_g1_i1.p1  ORF type:complete len:169 (-),score=25.16 TRINITY_DN1033_c0_g1_i1:344-850(-)